MATPNRTSSERDLNDVLAQIKEEMAKRKELKAQQEMTDEIKKLNNNLTSNTAKKQPPQVKIPTGRDIASAFIKSSPIFGRDFSGWVKESARYAQASNDELIQANKNLINMGSVDNSDQLTYLELIADQSGTMTDMIKDTGSKQLIRLDSIEKAIGQLGIDLVDGDDDMAKRVNNADRLQLKATMDIKNSLNKGLGRVVGELVKVRQENKRNAELMRSGANENIKDNKNNGLPQATSVVPTKPPEQDGTGGGFLAGVLGAGALGMLKKVLFAPLALVRGLVGIFTSMGGITSLLGKAAKFLRVGPLALITGIFEFGKGFFNAKEILGKAEVTVLDRVKAGVSELLGSFGDLVDWVAKIFGFDTNIGKGIRDLWMTVSQKPFEWAQSVVDWFKNDLFAGINLNTSLIDIPGKIADNLQKSLTTFVDWLADGIASLWTDTKKVMGEYIDDMKKGFSEKIKKPVFEFINAITNAMFDVLDKFVELIPDALGGEAARQKMKDLRDKMTIDVEPDPNVVKSDQSNILADPTGKPPVVQPEVKQPEPIKLPTQAATVNPVTSQELSVPQRESTLPTQAATVSEPKDILKGTNEPIPMMAVTPQYGQAAMNTQEMKQAQQATTQIIAPVNNTKNNINAPQNTTILNSPSLQPGNPMMSPESLWNF